MMGRFSSQAAQNRPAGQHPFHENRFGYSSDGQAGVYTGVAPPYHSSGQSTPGVNTMNNASGAPQESVISASQGFAAKLSGNEPGSPFMPTLFQGQQQPQAVQSTTPSNLPPSSQAETDASESMPGVTGSTSPSQPEWRVGPKPHVPIETKPATTLSTAGYTMGTGAGIQSQQQQQQRPTTQGYSSQVPFQGLQSQPPLPQPWGVDAASSAQTHSPGPHHGTPDAGTQDLPSALPSSQQGFNVQHTMMKPGGVQEQSPVNTYVQGSYSQPSPPPSSQGMYATHPQYQAFSPSQLKSEGVYTGSNPLPATTTTATTGSYGIPSSIHPSHASLASQAWGISQQIGGAFSHNSGSMGGYANNSGTYPQMANSQMDAFTGNNTHPGALQHYQPYHPGPHSGGPALGNYNQWGQSTAPAPPRAAMSDPQFVSGPWASVTPPGGGGMRPPPHYSGAYGYGGR
ncbi:hypothetical protein ASPZODRAFT_136450 [Penicilliopsis zonata CBS 506.65]|uniref:Uncharacterized protein n=1 Tax=Penicilliopsis zonata CBS 506.65 TaxID=1073090 RepID=A0A1L9S7V3_9EURO|nr:hypothetical protein ASPZODRAFT_136450 [Penicilliopsis zonata CBS 506.65]OJJ43243.1 hypothetical protein ASPZODRAFT_136450 [Penicilliopsis zonata CBS 506.65]